MKQSEMLKLIALPNLRVLCNCKSFLIISVLLDKMRFHGDVSDTMVLNIR